MSKPPRRREWSRIRLLPALLLVLLVARAGVALGRTAEPAPDLCTGRQLSGTFQVIPGSAGAGNVVYALRLRNRSAERCSLTGLPRVQLLSRTNRPLPTRVRAARRNALAPVAVVLGSGQTARATVRFSPDVPGPGEPLRSGQCEPTAFRLRVAGPGGGTTIAAMQPARPVCEHGTLQFSSYARG